MPALPEFGGIGKRALRVLEKGRRCTVADVHVGFAGHESDAEGLGGAKDPVVVVRGAEVERGRRAAAQKLGDTELGRRFDTVSIEGRLIRPGAKPKPVKELEAVGLMTEQRLHDVDVALDESRKYHRIAGVEDAGGTAIIA
jgi:hypothetical protein